MGRNSEKSISKVLVTVLIVSLFPIGCASTAKDSPDKYVFPTHNLETRANETVNYIQMALDFVQEYYPNKTYEIFNNSTWTPYPETGYQYEQIEIDIIPGNNSPEDTILVTIRHDTLNIEFGQEQYIRDYEDWYNLLPGYYKKMNSDYRKRIVDIFGYLPLITDAVSESYQTNFTIYYTQANQSVVISYLQAEKQNYSIIKTPYNNSSYIIANMSLQKCLLAANQSFIQQVGINTIIDFKPYTIESWQYNPESNYSAVILFTVIIIICISGFGYYIYKKCQHSRNRKDR